MYIYILSYLLLYYEPFRNGRLDQVASGQEQFQGIVRLLARGLEHVSLLGLKSAGAAYQLGHAVVLEHLQF